ncbi:MAG: MFS transporter [Acidiferrobacter sp.]
MTQKQPEVTTKDRRLILVTLCLGVFMVQVDTSVVNLAVHAIGVALHAPLAALQWIVDGYNLTYASLLLSGGILADLFGRRRILLLGSGIFTAGSLLCALAPSSAVLIMGRVMTGVGAALLLPSTLALIRVIWTDAHERAHVIGIWAGINGAALAIGPPLGGFLIPVAGWRSVFALTIPLGLAVIGLAARVIPESSDPTGRHMDLPGQILASLGFAALVVAVIESGPLASMSALASGLCFVLFYFVERRAGDVAMVPLPLLRNPSFAGAIGIAAAMTFGMYGLLFLLPLVWLQSGTLSTPEAGVALLPMALAFVVLSHKSGLWSRRWGVRPMIVGGMSLIGGGIGILSLTQAGRPLGLAEIGLLFTGIGMALNTGPLVAVAVAAVDSPRAGTASALVNTARMVGATLGVAVLGAVYAGSPSVAQGFTLAMEGGAIVVFTGAIFAVRIFR